MFSFVVEVVLRVYCEGPSDFWCVGTLALPHNVPVVAVSTDKGS